MKEMKDMDENLKKLTSLIDFSVDDPISKVIYDGLRKWIISGTIPLGYRLNEVHLSKALNISRTPIRDAIKQLTFEGLLESKPHMGTIVKTITKHDVLEVYQLRVALETLSFTNAMNNMTVNDFDNLNNLLNKTIEAFDAQEYQKVVELSSEFNHIINQFANMPRLTELLTNLKDYLYRFRVISMTSKQRGRIAIQEHQLIIRAMRNKDEQQIQYVLKEHLQYSLDCILEYLDETA